VEVLDDIIDTTKSQIFVKSPFARVLIDACDDLTLNEESKVEEAIHHLDKLKEVTSTKVQVEKLEKGKLDDQGKMELKLLPGHITYVFLEDDSKKPIIMRNSLSKVQEKKLVEVLTANQGAIGWQIYNLSP